MALVVIVSFFTIFLSAGGYHADTLSNIPLRTSCAGNYSAWNRAFQANIDSLFSSLNSLSPISNFGNTSAGNGTDKVFGLYMCQGDLSSDNCRSCVGAATVDILEKCPSSRQGVIWYDYCQLRYSDVDFFGVVDSRGFPMINPVATLENPELPLAIISRLVEEAPSSPLNFASNASVTAGVYALAQCTGDLAANACRSCLDDILKNLQSCCAEAEGYRYLSPTCWIRYEATPFLWNVNSTFTSIVVPRCPKTRLPQNETNPWEKRLSSLFSNLASNSSLNRGFATATTGGGDASLYGLAMCRADIADSSSGCQNCLNNASSSMNQMCPMRTQAIIWYEECELRYSNQSFFGTVDVEGRTFCSLEETSEAIDTQTMTLMMKLVEEAPKTPLLSAAGNQSFGKSDLSYGLVQCTRDLNTDDCRSCLTKGMTEASSSCRQRRGWRYLSGSCNLRYEKFPFFDTEIISIDATIRGREMSKGKLATAIIVPSLLAALLCGTVYVVRRKKKTRQDEEKYSEKIHLDGLETIDGSDLRLVDFETVLAATDNFSDANQIGKGGFGAVYKGLLPGGEKVAVKRLSSTSNQGLEEFKNEVTLIAKLQHRNLVRVLACCVETEEKILIYEFMPNGSLHQLMSDEKRRAQLEWKTRVNIILGIARGLLYLHEDSHLKIIHRDLKPSNVLLDEQMNPKIADFGMSKIVRNDEHQANTGRLVGTYGYMAPEFVLDGVFSAKSDVYSFGILMLEILSGRRNGRSFLVEHDRSLPGQIWKLWDEDRGFEVVDPLILYSVPPNEALRYLHIALLCIHENPGDRPTMSSVVLMLMTDHMALPEPSKPPTFSRESSSAKKLASSDDTESTNQVTVTVLCPR